MSLLSQINDKDATRLHSALSDAIQDAVENGKSEPSIVAQLTYGIPTFVNDLGLNIGKYTLKVGSVFIHQTPKVTFHGMVKQKSIEIGDLLVINTIIDKKSVTRKAILYQAKMFKKRLPSKPGNKKQHLLYEKWPIFEYINSTPELDGKQRKVIGLDLYSSAKYLILKKAPFPSINNPDASIVNNIALTAQPTATLSNYESFLNEIYHFVLGNSGKVFNYHIDKVKAEDEYVQLMLLITPKKISEFHNRGWSAVITDLLEVTARKTTSLMGTASGGGRKSARGCHVFGHKLSFITETVSDDQYFSMSDNNLPPTGIPPRSEDDNEDGGGISIIEFVLKKEEQEEPQKS